MREIVFDTETTGFEPETGDKLVEIGAVELINHLPTGKIYHEYINPERDVPEEVVKVHGLTIELGEIEASISTYPDINKCIVVVNSDQKIIAYFSANRNINTND